MWPRYRYSTTANTETCGTRLNGPDYYPTLFPVRQ